MLMETFFFFSFKFTIIIIHLRSLIYLSMNSWLRETSGKNMHYLLIIKIRSPINKAERKGTFVSSKARFRAFHWMFAEHHSVPLSWDQGWCGTREEEARDRSCCGTSVSQCGRKTHLDPAQVQEETACFLLVTMISSDKQFLWSPAHRDITGNDWVFTGGLCLCMYAQTCRAPVCVLVCSEIFR